MTPRDPHAQYSELAVGYAMHALEPEDEAVFSSHMSGCAECRSDVEQWRGTAGHLAYGAGAEAPAPELRERLMAAIGHDESVVRPLEVAVLGASNVGRLSSRSRRPVRTSRISSLRTSYGVPARALATAAALTGLVGGGVLVTTARQDASHAHHELSLRSAAMDALLHNGSKYFNLG